MQEPVGQNLGSDPIIPEVRRSLFVSLKLAEVFPNLVVGSGPNLIKDGAQIGNSLPNFSEPRVEEFAHFCECPECSSLCLVVLESHVETFLCTQFLRTDEILRDPHPKLAGLTGCFSIWLDWFSGSPALKAFLLAVGMFQIIPWGVDSDNPLSPLQHWLTLGAPRPLQDSVSLFCASGFEVFSENVLPFKGIVFSLYSKGHVLAGPMLLGHSRCLCGRSRQDHSLCMSGPFGPREFVVWLKAGRCRRSQSSRLFWFIGSYEIQEIIYVDPTPDSLLSRSKSIHCVPGPQSVDRRVVSNPVGSYCFKECFSLVKRYLVKFSDLPGVPPREPLALSEAGYFDLPIPSVSPSVIVESVSSAPLHPSPVSSDIPETSLPGVPGPSGQGQIPRDLTQVFASFYRKAGCSEEALRVLLCEYAPRTFKQYQGAWSRFVHHLSEESIPAGDISETTVVDFLASRLKPDGFKGRLKGKLSPQSIRSELYGLLGPLRFQFGLEIDPTIKGSLIKRFLAGAFRLAVPRSDNFPKWNLKDLLNYLSSEVFEPPDRSSLDDCKLKAIILMMLATGRRFEEVQALTRTWLRHVTRSGIVYYRFTFYEGWRAKAQNDDGWCPEDIILFPIDQGPDLPDLSHLCPVRAFQAFWDRCKFLGDPSFLWLESTSVDLSHAVVSHSAGCAFGKSNCPWL